MANLLDSFKTSITPQTIAKLSESLGENEESIARALAAFAPAILGGLVSKAGDVQFMQQQFDTLVEFQPRPIDDLAALVAAGNLAQGDPKDAAGHWLSGILGNKIPSILNAISAFAGTRNTTTSALLGMAGPMVMGMLNKRITMDGLNVSGLTNLLLAERNTIVSMLPSGLDSILGLSAGPAASVADSDLEHASNGTSWLWPFLLLLGLGAAIVLLSRNCSQTPVAQATEEVNTTEDTSAVNAEVQERFDKTLSSGFALKGAAAAGVEQQLLDFIESDKPVDKTTWFNFDRLTFETNSAELNMERSREQLTNIYEILKAFPAVNLKIGGYTDNTGDEGFNMKLSSDRAKAVQKALVDMGVEDIRLDAEGYGSQHPVASNDTEEGRAQNRRTAVRVTTK